MSFVPNNIRFRSVSSKSNQHFYGTKAYILNELLMEKNQFSEVARETMLLLFNSYSDWIMGIERVFLNQPVVTDKEVSEVLLREEQLQQYHLDVFKLHENLFEPKFVELWYRTNAHTREAFRYVIRGTERQSHLEAYPIILAGLENMLQMCLQELYEIDCLLGSDFVHDRCSTNRSNGDRLVVYVDNFTLDYFTSTQIFMCSERLKIYSELTCGKFPVHVKNYSAGTLKFTGVVEGDPLLVALLNRCLPYVDIVDIETVPLAF